MPLGGQQLLFGDLGMVVEDTLSVQRQRGGLWAVCRAQDPGAFEPGGGGQPPRQGVRAAEVAKLFHQAEPDALAGVLGLGGAQPVPAADGPHQRRVPLDNRVPRLLVTGCGAHHQVGDRLIIVHRVHPLLCLVLLRSSAVVSGAGFTFDRGDGADHAEQPTEQPTESERGYGAGRPA